MSENLHDRGASEFLRVFRSIFDLYNVSVMSEPLKEIRADFRAKLDVLRPKERL